MKRKIFYIFLLAALSGVALMYLLYDGKIRLNYPDKDKFPLAGIDISHHQGKIDWEALREEGISFVIIKATEGGDFKDRRFAENWADSKQEGYRTGAYHFYRFCKTGEEQARNFIESVPVEEDNLPPAIDLEFGGSCVNGATKQDILREVKIFLDTLEAHYGKKPIIYSTNEFYEQYLQNEFPGHPIWIRNIYQRPRLKDGRNWAIWQYANRGHLSGIDTYVDLNVINGSSFEVVESGIPAQGSEK
jgi:lysozyme